MTINGLQHFTMVHNDYNTLKRLPLEFLSTAKLNSEPEQMFVFKILDCPQQSEEGSNYGAVQVPPAWLHSNSLILFAEGAWVTFYRR